MSAIIPASGFLYSPGGDITRVALGRAINKSGEIKDHIERTNFLYSAMNRRAILAKCWIPALRTGTTSATNLPDTSANLATTRTATDIVTFGANITVAVSAFNASSGAAVGATVTLVHTSATNTEQTTSLSALTVSDLLFRVTVSKTDASISYGYLESIRILEKALLVGALP